MIFIKDILTTENIPFLDLKLNTFVLTASIIFIVIVIIFLYLKKPIIGNIMKLAFLTLTILTFLFSFIYAFTGEYLFSKTENMEIFMIISMVAILLYIYDSFKEILTENNHPNNLQSPH